MADITEKILNDFPRRRIVIVGDLVADQFLCGKIARVSREAPVFILSHDETETRAGGAANAATNVSVLGGKAIAVGLLGDDSNGTALLKQLTDSGVDCSWIVKSSDFQTTTKVRILAGQSYAARQQVIRVDYENKTPVLAETRQKLKENLHAACEKADAIILSDYCENPALGVISNELAKDALKISREKNIPLVIDSRYRLAEFTGASSATPNQDEVEQLIGKNFAPNDCVELLKKLGYQSLLITRGNKGMLLVERDHPPLELEAIGSKEPVDVTGAGDTVIATYALSLASGMTFSQSAELANHAGGIVVMKKRTATADPFELIESLDNHKTLKQKA